MTIETRQSFSYSGKDWWDWSVWLEGTSQELDAVTHVIYTLHSTFRDPVRLIETRSNGFRLDSAGWGGFEIYIEIVRADGSRLKLVHELELEYPQSPAPSRTGKNLGATSNRALPKPPPKSATPSATKERPEHHPMVYVSSGAADSDLARLLKEKLTSHGVIVTSVNDIAVGQQWESSVKQAIKKSDAAVFIVSGQPSLWSKLEMGYAMDAEDKQVIPLLVGTRAQVPPALADHHALQIGSAKEIDSAMTQILQATKVIA